MRRDDDQEGWTTVRYGRRRRRHFSPPPQRRPSSPRYARENRPVTWSNGYRRSYASVTRGPRTRHTATRPMHRQDQWSVRPDRSSSRNYNESNQRSRPMRRFQGNRSSGPEHRTRDRTPENMEWWRTPKQDDRAASARQRGEATSSASRDSPFQIKVRILHRIIKATHHLHNVSQEKPPLTIAKMTRTLSSLIKPSTPSDSTTDLIVGNAKNWEFTTVLILRDHYLKVIDSEIENLLALPDRSWKEPFSVAANWARRNLGRRLLAETVQQAEALLIARVSDNEPAPSLQHQMEESQQTHTTVTAVENVCEAPPPRSVTLQHLHQITVEAQIHPRPASSPVSEAEQPSPWQQKLIPPVLQSVATMTETRGDWSPSPQHLPEEGVLEPVLQLMPSPQPQREKRISRLIIQPEPISLPTSPSAGLLTTPQPTTTHLIPSTSTPRNLEGALGEEVTSAQPHQASFGSQERPLLDLDEETLRSLLQDSTGPQRESGTTTQASLLQSSVTMPSALVRRPMRHVNTLYKVKNWSLTVRHKWLILGDSNVSRFPPYNIPHLQIDSFPGATFLHLRGVLDKLEPDSKVQILILSLGINNRTQKSPETSIAELRKLMTVAKSKFPQATVWVPIISFSRSLPRKEQNHLHVINRFIHTHCLSLPELPRSMFTVERDGIHWSHATAGRLLEHWAAIVK